MCEIRSLRKNEYGIAYGTSSDKQTQKATNITTAWWFFNWICIPPKDIGKKCQKIKCRTYHVWMSVACAPPKAMLHQAQHTGPQQTPAKWHSNGRKYQDSIKSEHVHDAISVKTSESASISAIEMLKDLRKILRNKRRRALLLLLAPISSWLLCKYIQFFCDTSKSTMMNITNF